MSAPIPPGPRIDPKNGKRYEVDFESYLQWTEDGRPPLVPAPPPTPERSTQ